MTTNTQATDSTRVSYGRGGAGNISSKPHDNPADLVTPTIKSPTYTTGRGGTGNMAKNDPTNPAIARERQDVASLPRRMSEGESHFGRGTSPFPSAAPGWAQGLPSRKDGVGEREVLSERRELGADVLVGTGGAANTIRPSAEEIARAKEENARIEQAARERELKGKGKLDAEKEKEVRGLADKGKGLLGKGVGK